MTGYERTTPIPTDVRRAGDRLIVVGVIGPGYHGARGFTIWERNECVAGRTDPARDDVTAARQAELALRNLDAAPSSTKDGGPRK